MYEEIREQAATAIKELLEAANLKRGDILVVGCSSSEITGGQIGKSSSTEAAGAVFEGVYPKLCDRGIYLAAQCCEHLNRALVIERRAAEAMGYEIVSAVPQPSAGGSFAAAAYNNYDSPVLVERVRAKAGIDIGGTLIGMHLIPVAVPVRLSISAIGRAGIICAKTRPRYIGGSRTAY